MTDELHVLTYVGIAVSAVIEGEVVYVAAVVLAVAGKLNPLAVLISGAAGGSGGDQIFFYLLRSRFSNWLSNRFPSVMRRRDRISEQVNRKASLLILASRFLPGLRIAIPVACAYAGVNALKFSILSLISGFLWAGAIMAAIMYVGPKSFSELGIHTWWTPIIPAVLIIVFFRWLAKAQKSD